MIKNLFTLLAGMILLFLPVPPFSPDNAYANGSPGAWSGGTPGGAFIMKQDDDIRLREENLDITIVDGNEYRVKATYELDNGGREKKVLFGVPIIVKSRNDDPGPVPEVAVPVGLAEKQANSISLTLNSTRFPCGLSRQTAADAVKGAFKGIQDDNYEIVTWCTAELLFPGEKRSTLVMEYSARMFSMDAFTSATNVPSHETRTLTYPFFPAGSWKGMADSLRVTVNMEGSPYWSFTVERGPKAPKISGRAATWALANVDFRSLPDLVLAFPGEQLDKYRLLHWNRADNTERVAAKVTASSTLADQGKANYRPINVMDDRPETAWCEGVAGPGRGEWLQLRPDKSINSSRVVEGLMITPGYVKNQRSYLSNGRVKRLRVSDCEGRNPFDVAIDLAENYEMAPVAVRFPDNVRTFLSDASMSCIQVTVLDIAEGSAPDTCISEIGIMLMP
jgi:hypothetical protein